MGVNYAAALLGMVVVAAALAGSAAQNPPQCASNLVGCAGYINSTATPPESCCGPLKEAAKNQLPCLCALFNNTAILKAFGVNITQALQMAKRCGVSADQSACASLTPSGGAASPSSPGSSTNGTGSPESKSDNSAFLLTSVGLPGAVSLLLFWWSLVV